MKTPLEIMQEDNDADDVSLMLRAAKQIGELIASQKRVLSQGHACNIKAEHYGPDGISHVLEIVGSYWVGASFLLFSTLLVFDLCTGFGLWPRPQLPAIRTLTLGITLDSRRCAMKVVEPIHGLFVKRTSV